MHPILFHIGPVKFYTYGLMIALGFLLATALMQRDARRTGVIDPNLLAMMSLWALVLGVLGTRLLHIIMYPEGYSWSDPIGWINLTRGGLVFHGAIPVVLVYCIVELRRRKIPFWPVADIVMPYVPLAHAFGRMGCFFYSCCYGKRADNLPWAVRFPEGSQPYLDHASHPGFPLDQHWSYPVHPTQLYSVLGLLLLFGLLYLLRAKWHPFAGFTFPVYFIGYGLKRFIVEFYRGDGNPTNFGFGVLSNQQVFCIVMVVVGAGLFVYLKRRAMRLGQDAPLR